MKFNKQNRLEQSKRKIIHPAASEESHRVTDPLGKTVEQSGDELIAT